MCGIIGILGQSPVVGRLLDGLARLEYRGYDSAGVAILTEDGPALRRAVGKLASLRRDMSRSPCDGMVGIGHTRWATHGAPTRLNAHPHRSGKVTVVHNGIIENYAEIREEMAAEGRTFQSETDTEIVAVLCDTFLRRGDTPHEAVRKTLQKLQGAYALVFLFDHASDQLIVAKLGSPLVIGYGQPGFDGSFEMFVGSDAVALAHKDRKLTPAQCDIAVAELAGDLDLYRQPRQVFEPVLGDVASIMRSPASHEHDAVDTSEIDPFQKRLQRQGMVVHQRGKSAPKAVGLFMDLLGHEVLPGAFVRQKLSGLDFLDVPHDLHALAVLDQHLVAAYNCYVPVLEIADLGRQRC